MLPLSKTKNRLILMILMNVIMLGAYFFVFQGIHAKSEEVTMLEGQLSLELSGDERLRSIDKLIEDSTKEREELEMYLIRTEEEAVTFVELLEDMGEWVGASVSITSLGILDAEDLGTSVLIDTSIFEVVDIQISVEGTFEEVTDFLRYLEYIPKHHTLERVSLERQLERPGELGEGASTWKALIKAKFLKLI